jgi:hypothetical protein
MNAFKNNRTTLNQELRDYRKRKDSEYGAIEIKKFTVRHGKDLMPHLNFISTDDGKL